jgi:hypothetical protein
MYSASEKVEAASSIGVFRHRILRIFLNFIMLKYSNHKTNNNIARKLQIETIAKDFEISKLLEKRKNKNLSFAEDL